MVIFDLAPDQTIAQMLSDKWGVQKLAAHILI